MELYFNELSLPAEQQLAYSQQQNVLSLYSEVRKYRINTCRVEGTLLHALIAMVSANQNSHNSRDLLYSFFKPLSDEETLNGIAGQDYLEHVWKYQGTVCTGLAIACVMESAVISIDVDDFHAPEVTVSKDAESVNVRNFSNAMHVEFHREWLESTLPLNLRTTDLSPSAKEVSLRPDHGSNILYEYSKKLLRSPYVVSVVNSIQFNPYYRSFIRKASADGTLEIVLYWTDEGFGLVVQTTGRNKRETEKIGEILKEQYGRF